MNFPISFFMFMVVLFLYVHVNHQYKKSQDLEIYELDYKGIENLQETCDIRRPIVFDFAQEHGLKTLQMSLKSKNLEQIFREKTKK